MADTVSPLPGRGQTLLSGAGRTLAATGQAVKLEGTLMNFNDRDSTATGLATLRSNRQVTMMLVRNVSGFAVLSKRMVRWKTGKRGKQIDGYSCIGEEEVAGVVDEFIGSAGVPNNDLFWMAVKGPALIRKGLAASAADNEFEVGELLTALTAATSQCTSAGSPYTGLAAGTTNITAAVSMVINQIGRALSAATSANTGGSAVPYLLADLDILKSA